MRPVSSGPVTRDDVVRAAETIRGRVRRTPLLDGSGLAPRLFLKAELFQHGGSFKARGVTNRLAAMSADERERGVAGASAGNHAIALAWGAAAEGLEYHLDRSKGGNSFDAHRMIHLAATYGHQADAQERLMRAYFTEGESLGVWDTLVRLMEEIGVDGAEAREALRLDKFAEDVREDEVLAQQFGIQGVPFFVFDRRYGLSGAQPADVMLTALERAWEEASSLQA